MKMNLNEYIDQLSNQGVQLSAENNNIRIRAPKNVLTKQHYEMLSQYKKDILELLRTPKNIQLEEKYEYNPSDMDNIENALMQHPYVAEVAVRRYKNGVLDKGIIFIVPVLEADLNSDEISEWIIDKCQVDSPSEIIIVNDVPVFLKDETSNSSRACFVPRNPTEEIMAAIFMDVLNLAEIGIYDNFFHLGGNSLLGAQIANGVDTIFQTGFPFLLRGLFSWPTIADFSAFLKKYEIIPGRTDGIAQIRINISRKTQNAIADVLFEKRNSRKLCI